MRIITSIAVFLHVTFVAGETPNHPPADSSSDIWYTQIGKWHLVNDTSSRDAHLYHNAAVDGMQSGQARSDLKYNRQISGLTRLTADFSLGENASAGFLLRVGKISYRIYLEKNYRNDSVRIVRSYAKESAEITVFSAILPDTVRFELFLSRDSLRMSAGNWTRSIHRPADLPDSVMIGLTCSRGEVRVWKLRMEAPPLCLDETFDHATVINLGLEKMFKVRSTHTRRTRPALSPK